VTQRPKTLQSVQLTAFVYLLELFLTFLVVLLINTKVLALPEI